MIDMERFEDIMCVVWVVLTCLWINCSIVLMCLAGPPEIETPPSSVAKPSIREKPYQVEQR